MNATRNATAPAQLGDDRRARPAVLVAAQQREHEQEQAGGQRDLAGHVELAGVRVARLLDRLARDRDADQAERQVDEEDPAPVEAAGERAADERADGEGGADRSAVGGERLAALLRVRERLREQGERDGEHDRGADALRGARGVQHHDVRGRRAHERRHGEDGETDREQPATTEAVGQRAGRQHDGGEGEGVGVDDPLQAGQARVEVGGDVGQRGVHDRDVEHQHRGRRTHHGEGPALR